MAQDLTEGRAQPAAPVSLSEAETAFIEYFVRIAQAFGLPKSLGQLFGFLFAQTEAVSFDHIRESLGQSKGSVSMGLRALQRIQAVRTEYIIGDRRTFYVAETSLRRLFTGLIDDTVVPQLRTSMDALQSIDAQVQQLSSPAQQAILLDRVARLRNWIQKSRLALPIILKLFPS